jgi:hypothetical protein
MPTYISSLPPPSSYPPSYDDDIPLVVPEINAAAIGSSKLIANPNCTTAIAVMALWPLHRRYGIKRLLVSTYQAASGAGQEGMEELRTGMEHYLIGRDCQHQVFAHPLPFNVIPHIDKFQVRPGAFLFLSCSFLCPFSLVPPHLVLSPLVRILVPSLFPSLPFSIPSSLTTPPSLPPSLPPFQENGYTKEEMKVAWETRKIFDYPHMEVSCTGWEGGREGGREGIAGGEKGTARREGRTRGPLWLSF